MEEKGWGLLEEADWHFRKLVRGFVKERDKISVEGVPLPGILILNSILRDGEQRLGDLAEQLDFTSGAVTAVCDKLESLGYAIRKRSESDRRSVTLDITEEGREMLLRNREVGTYMIHRIFGAFSQDELKEQISYFARLNAQVKGFAEAVLHQSQASAETDMPEANRRPEHSNRTNKFISY